MSVYSWINQRMLKKVMELYFTQCCNGPDFENQEDKKFEFQRLNSFQNWPKESSVFPLKLAKAGFYYEGNVDEVICFHCGIKKCDWQAGDSPVDVHKDCNPNCEFIADGASENIPLSQDRGSDESERLKRLDRLLEIQAQSYFPYDCVIPGEQNPSSQSEANLSSTFGDLSVSNKQNKEASGNTEDQAVAGAPTMSSSKPDKKKKGTRAGSGDRGTQEPAPSSSQAARGTNVSDARVAQPPAQGATNTTKGGKGKSGKDSKQSPARDLDLPPPSGNELGPLRFERNRLETYKDWPSEESVPAAELAKWGFYYTGAGDRVKCIFCKGMLRNWEAGDRPHIEHRKHFPRCPLILGLRIGNIPLPLDINAATTPPSTNEQQSRNVSDAQSNMETLGIITERPKHPQYAVESQRLASFQSWPPYKYQTPQKLANAGFWYAGFNDNVKCFYCNGGLRNWEPGDEPWVEHARWFPGCQFVKQVKGQEFITKVLREKGTGSELAAAETEPTPAVAPGNPKVVKFVVEERALRARMDRPDIKKVQDMGYNRDLIMKALRKRFTETGDDFPSATALLEGIFAMENEGSLAQSRPSPEDESAMEVQSADDLAESQEVDKQSQHASDKDADTMTGSEENKANKDEEFDKENKPRTGNIRPDRDDLEKENLELREQRLCKICMTEEASMAFLPCGHLVSCASCSPALQNCPICRGEIKGIVKTYLA